MSTLLQRHSLKLSNNNKKRKRKEEKNKLVVSVAKAVLWLFTQQYFGKRKIIVCNPLLSLFINIMEMILENLKRNKNIRYSSNSS